MPKITEQTVISARRKAKESKRAIMVWDSELRGFGFRASPTGRVSWMVQTWQGGRGGKAQRAVLASLGLEDARTEAYGKIQQMRNGVDLVGIRRAKREEKRKQLQAPKLQTLVSLYLKRKSKKHSEGYREELGQMFDNIIIPHLGKNKRI